MQFVAVELFIYQDPVASFHKLAFCKSPLAIGTRFNARTLDFALAACNTPAMSYNLDS